MRNTLFILLLFITQLSFAQTDADYIFQNVNVVSMTNDKVLNDQTVVVKDGKIIEISKNTKLKAKTTVDAKGKYLMPGMADAHVHFPDSEAEMEKALKLNLINGVTKLRSMRGDWNHTAYRKKYNAPDSYYPKLYLSAPPLHRSHKFTAEELENYVKAAKEYGFDFIKILSIKDEQLLGEVDALCKKYGMNIGGHHPYNDEGKPFADKIVFKTNYNSIEHLGGLMDDAQNYESRIELIKNNKIFICPTMKWYTIGYGQYDIEEMYAQGGMQYFTETLKDKWAEQTRQYRAKLGVGGFKAERAKYATEMQERYKVVKRLNDEGVKLLLSPDASTRFIAPGFGMMEEMKLYQVAGLNNYDILRAATVNFALLFKENYGTIAKGKDADFILLNNNPLQNLKTLENVEAVFFNNHYLDKEQLKAIANSVLPQ